MMSSLQAMAGLVLLLLVLLVNVAAGTLTVQQTVENGCTGDLDVQCRQLGKDFGLVTLLPGASSTMTFNSTLEDPDLTCDFKSLVLADLKTTKSAKIWEYLKSGFTDNPEMTCSAGCVWKPQDDGLYYRALDGSFVLFIKWAAIIPSVPA